MSKRLFLCVFFLLFVFLSNSYAVPQYYTFEGTVRSIADGGATIAEVQGFSVGSSIDYTVLIDFDADGYILQPDGSRDIMEDGYGPEPYTDNYLDYFYAEFISGTVLTNNSVPSDALITYYGVEEEYGQGTPGTVDTDLALLTMYDRLSIGAGLFIEEWIVGASFEGLQYIWNNESSILMQSDLILTNISDVAPVPEPSTIVLMGLGLVGLAGYGRKRMNR